MNFNKFQGNFILKVAGTDKTVYKDSYEQGQGKYVYSSIPDFLNETFTISEEKMNTKVIENLVLAHLREQLGCKELDATWLKIGDTNNIMISINEIEEYYTQYCPDIKMAESEGKQVYLADYEVKLFINNMKITSEDLQNIFPKTEYM